MLATILRTGFALLIAIGLIAADGEDRGAMAGSGLEGTFRGLPGAALPSVHRIACDPVRARPRPPGRALLAHPAGRALPSSRCKAVI